MQAAGAAVPAGPAAGAAPAGVVSILHALGVLYRSRRLAGGAAGGLRLVCCIRLLRSSLHLLLLLLLRRIAVQAQRSSLRLPAVPSPPPSSASRRSGLLLRLHHLHLPPSSQLSLRLVAVTRLPMRNGLRRQRIRIRRRRESSSMLSVGAIAAPGAPHAGPSVHASPASAAVSAGQAASCAAPARTALLFFTFFGFLVGSLRRQPSRGRLDRPNTFSRFTRLSPVDAAPVSRRSSPQWLYCQRSGLRYRSLPSPSSRQRRIRRHCRRSNRCFCQPSSSSPAAEHTP